MSRRIKTGDVVRHDGTSKVVIFATYDTPQLVIAGTHRGRGETIDPRPTVVLSRKHQHSCSTQLDDQLCAGCVFELYDAAKRHDCPRCTAELSQLIDSSRAHELDEIGHADSCRRGTR